LFTKLKAGLIFNGTGMMDNGMVVIRSGDGTIADIISEEDAGDDIQELDGILSPGFINCHCHVELSYLQNVIPKDTGLVDFVSAVMTNRRAADEEKISAMIRARDSMYRSGIVAVADICNDTDSIPAKKDGNIWWRNFIEISGFIDATSDQRLQSGLEVLHEFEKQLPGFPSSLTAHSPYSVSSTLFRSISRISKNKTLSVHNQECLAENRLYEKGDGDLLRLYDRLGLDIKNFKCTGSSSLRSWLPYFDPKQSLILVHNSFITPEDLEYAKNYKDLYYCLCPNANLFIENVLPPVEMIMQNSKNIVLGTDSYASNDKLDILAEIRTLNRSFPFIPLTDLLTWATRNGALALGIAGSHGTIEKGKKPGLVLIDHELKHSSIID